MTKHAPGTSVEGFDVLENWRNSPNSRMSLIDQGGTLLWQIGISKTDNVPSICSVKGLSVPADLRLSIKIFPKSEFLLLAIEDSEGNVGLQGVLPGIVSNVWNEVRIQPNQLPVMGLPGARLKDVTALTFIVEAGAGEFNKSGEYSYCFREACIARPEEPALSIDRVGGGVRRPYEDLTPLTMEDLRQRLQSLEDQLTETEDLLVQCEAKGTACHYEKASLALFFDRKAVMEDYERGLTGRATETLIFYEKCLARTRRSLQRVLDGTTVPKDVPDPEMTGLGGKDGCLYSGEEPVILTGLVGWGLKEHLPLLKRMGFNFFSIETGLAATMPTESGRQVEPNVIETLCAAGEQNMAMDLLLSPHYFPEWAYREYPEIDRDGFRRTRSPFSPWNVSDPNFRALVKEYVSYLIPKIKDCPALASIDLANEVWWAIGADYPIDEFQRFLQGMYPTLADLNKSWGTKFKRWNRVNIVSTSHASWVDFNRYNQARLADFYGEYAKAVQEAGWRGSTYAKVIGSQYEVIGVDKDRLTENLSACGIDCYPRFRESGSALEAGFSEQQTIIDLYRSCYPDKPVIDTEYHIIGYNSVVTPEYIKALMWDGAVHGRSAAAVWVWGRGIENEAQSLFTQPWAVEALCHTSLDLRRLGEEVTSLQRVNKEMALLYSGSRFLDVYEEAYFTGVPFDVLPIGRFDAERLKRYGIVVVANEAVGDESALKALQGFVKAGGSLLIGENALRRSERGKDLKCARLFQEAWDSERCTVFQQDYKKGALTNRIHFFANHHISADSRPVILTDETAALVPHVTWRARVDDSGILLFALNYGAETINAEVVRCDGRPVSEGRDLVSGYCVRESLKLPPLTPRLLKY